MSRKRNYKKNKNRMLKIKEILNKKEYPDICLITGLEKWEKIKKHYRLKVKYNKRGQICKVKQLKY